LASNIFERSNIVIVARFLMKLFNSANVDVINMTVGGILNSNYPVSC